MGPTPSSIRAVLEAEIKRSKSPIETTHDYMVVPPRECAPQFWEMLEEYWPEAVREFNERQK
jgi:hypothetical protein